MARPSTNSCGVYVFRKRVPEDLVAAVGTREVKRSLNTKDPAQAKSAWLTVAAEIERQWAALRAGNQALSERDAHAIAKTAEDRWYEMHSDNPSQQVTWHTELYADLWTAALAPEVKPQPGSPGERPLTNIFYLGMREFCFDQADNALTHHGFTVSEWDRLKLAHAIGAAIQRASIKLSKEEHGFYDPNEQPRWALSPTAPNAVGDPGKAAAQQRDLSTSLRTLTGLLTGWWQEAKAAGRKPSTYESYRNTVRSFVAFLSHDDAHRVAPQDVVAFKDHRLSTPSPRTGRVASAKTVKDCDLAALKTIFGWATVNHHLARNPAHGITIKLGKTPKLRSKGFTDAEAIAILSAASAYTSVTERPKTVAAKRWVPWLCAHTGARVGELAQLRRCDVRQDGQHWVIRITPEAGTQKTNEARDVVLHPQLIDLGFTAFVATAADGPLFLTPAPDGDVLGPLQGVKNRLAEFARAIVPDPKVSPNHGWRHRFKSVGMEADIAPRILDAIQGQAPRSVADTYGDVTITTMARAIAKLPWFQVGQRIGDTDGAGITD